MRKAVLLSKVVRSENSTIGLVLPCRTIDECEMSSIEGLGAVLDDKSDRVAINSTDS